MCSNVLSSDSESAANDLLDEVLRLLCAILMAGGLSRSEVMGRFAQAAVRGDLSEQFQKVVSLGPRQRELMEVMCRWRRDPLFLDNSAIPAALPRWNHSNSFAELCRRSGARTHPDDIITTLVEFGAIEIDADGNLVPRTPTFLLSPGAQNNVVALDGVLRQIAGFLKVIEHNLVGSRNGGRPRFERSCTVRVSSDLVPVFERIVKERGQEFIDSIDEWLERKSKSQPQGGQRVEIGVGAYFVDLGIGDDKSL